MSITADAGMNALTRFRQRWRKRAAPIAGLRHAVAMKLTVWLFGLFFVVLLIALSISYAVVRAEFEDRIDRSLARQAEDLLAAVEQRASTSPGGNRAVLWRAEVTRLALRLDADDRVLVWIGEDGSDAGNARVRDLGAPAATLERRPGFGNLEDDGYHTRVFDFAEGRLLLGETRDPLNDVEEVFLAVLVWTILPTLTAAGLLGILIALGTTHRVRRIERVLERLGQGDFSARHSGRVHRDDLGRLAQAVDRMADSQERLIAGMRRVTADIAHDLRTPLQRIRARIDQAARADSAAECASALDRADAEIEQALRVFAALLQIARLDASADALQRQPTDLAAMCAQLVELYQPSFDDAGRHLFGTESATPAIATVEPTLFGQMVTNLLENALRHTPAGSHTHVSVRTVNAAVVVSVSDDGPGIPVSERQRVLEPLLRGDQARTSEGHGLGLTLVAAIARIHAATLELDDGTADDRQASASTSHLAMTAPCASGRGLRVRITFLAD